jgi:hypothetical protein
VVVVVVVVDVVVVVVCVVDVGVLVLCVVVVAVVDVVETSQQQQQKQQTTTTHPPTETTTSTPTTRTTTASTPTTTTATTTTTNVKHNHSFCPAQGAERESQTRIGDVEQRKHVNETRQMQKHSVNAGEIPGVGGLLRFGIAGRVHGPVPGALRVHAGVAGRLRGVRFGLPVERRLQGCPVIVHGLVLFRWAFVLGLMLRAFGLVL